jgi:hypothetical protein
MQATTTRKLANQRPIGVGILAAAALAAGLAIGAIAGVTVKSAAAPAATVNYGLSPDAQDSTLQAKPGAVTYGLSPDARDEFNKVANGVTAIQGVSGGLANPAPRFDAPATLPDTSQWSRIRDAMQYRTLGSNKIDYGYSSTHPAAR